MPCPCFSSSNTGKEKIKNIMQLMSTGNLKKCFLLISPTNIYMMVTLNVMWGREGELDGYVREWGLRCGPCYLLVVLFQIFMCIHVCLIILVLKATIGM